MGTLSEGARSPRPIMFRALLLVLLLALALLPLALGGCAKHEPAPAVIPPVQLARVQAGSAETSAVFAGEVKPRYETDLAFRIGGKVIARAVDTGSRVRKGQLLARLDPADVGLAAQAATAAVAAAEAEHTFAKAEYERYQHLHAENFVSASALEQKRNLLNASQARLDQARAQEAVTRNQAAYATLVAPEKGVITAVAAEVGQIVAMGQAVLRFAREEEREVAISVPENRVREIERARELVVSLWANPQQVYSARVREIAPAVDPVTRTFAVRVSILEPDATIQWGMTANVALRGGDAAGAVLIPLSALYRQAHDPAVWVYDPKSREVALRAVKIAQFREDGIVVASGLRDGEWIVAAGVNKLQPGQIVRPYAGDAGGETPAIAAPAAS